MILQLFLNGIIAGSIYALIAIGFVVIYRTVRFFHLAHGAVYAVGAYIAYSLIFDAGINSIIAFFLASIAAGLVGVAIDYFVYKPLRKRKASNLIYLLASFGVFIFIQNLMQMIYGAQILTIRTGPVKVGHQLFGAIITDIQILILVVSILLFVLIWYFIKHSKIGKAMRAVADDPLGAQVIGINSDKIIRVSFLIGSTLAGSAGILVSLETNIEPTMGFNAILKGMIAAIIGGIGSLPGAVIGGFFLGIVENIGIWKIQAGWKDSIAFAILIIFLLFRPGGIMNISTQKERV